MLHYDEWGSSTTYPHMSVAWSWAFDTPFKWTKEVASHFGGTRQGLAISWPGHIMTSAESHAVPPHDRCRSDHSGGRGNQGAEIVDGITQKPIEGVSMGYTFDKANAERAIEARHSIFRDGR